MKASIRVAAKKRRIFGKSVSTNIYCSLFSVTFVNSVTMMRRDEISARKKPSSSLLLLQRNPVMMKKKDQTSLVDLCVEKAIDNVKYLGDVSHVDHHMLEKILPHCTLDQLMHIEKSSEGMDLSPITDKLWKKFFEKQFGINCTNEVVKKMKEKRVSFTWLKHTRLR